jgi:long-chain acyl-CoA synthetase
VSATTTRPRPTEGDLSWPLRRAAALYSDVTAIVDGRRTITYGELARRVDGVGAGLDSLGVTEGGRVGFLGVNSPAHLECTLGVPAHGRLLVDLNLRLSETELAFMADDCALEALIVDRARLAVGRALRARCGRLRELVLDDSGEGGDGRPDDVLGYERLIAARTSPSPSPSPRPIDQRSPAVISYTGGTTGAPKGVTLSHGNLLSNARHNLIATGHSTADTWLHVCPMFHVAGTANVIACTWVGARQVIVPRFEARAVVDAIVSERVTHVALVPTMISMLLDELRRRPHERLESLRHVQYAASPITPEVQRELLERLDCEVVQFYGMTEAAPTVTRLGGEDHRRGAGGQEPHARRLRSIGTPVVGVQTRVVSPNGEPARTGEVGELWVRGPNVMIGYWRRPDATAAALAGDWYRTGDAVREDDDGYLYLVDRLKDMIITGAENVYCIEVEAALTEHPAVREAAVFGIPDARWGEAVHAVVRATDVEAVRSSALIEHCRARIAGYKVPRSIEIRTDPLPRSAAGKLLKNPLRDPFWAGTERRVN